MEQMAERKVKVGFQGQKGAYSETAVLELFASQRKLQEQIPEPLGYHSFSNVFDAVQNDEVDYGLVPIENSSTGTFHFTYDLLIKYSLYIVGEFQFHESHCLLALPGVNLEDITKVQSHPYAIDQCRGFLSSLDKTVVISQTPDTATSAAEIATQRLETTAAIAGRRAAEIYNLAILKEGIEDTRGTITRYVLVARRPITPERHEEPRTSLSLMMRNQVGAFHKAVAAFALRDINIAKLESRPVTSSIQMSRPWEYMLYVDVDGSTSDTPLQNALKHLEEFAQIRMLGSYPRHIPPRQPRIGPLGIGY
ncbi:Prephenate dehydratase-domain-containing protein [Gaertneriomyces semiglobifer]|nr:Prephenate dehydratase-domain-containing protein [Gaertneriomyces semiglobifer]